MATTYFPRVYRGESYSLLTRDYEYVKKSASWVTPPWTETVKIRAAYQSWLSYKSDKVTGDGVKPTPYCRQIYKLHEVEPEYKNDPAVGGISYVTRDRPLIVTDMTYFPMQNGKPSNTSTVPGGNTENLERVKTKALANLVDGEIHLGATAVELRETANHLADRGRKYCDVMNAMLSRGRKGRRARRSIRKWFPIAAKAIPGWGLMTAAQRWLEWRYAIIPLIKDIQGGWELYAKGIDNNAFEVSTGSKYRYKYTTNTLVNTSAGYLNRLSNIVIDYKCRLTASIDDPELFAQAKLGLDFKSALWEAVPFSFVLDWGLKVGTFLQALSALSAGLKFKHGYILMYRHEMAEFGRKDTRESHYRRQSLVTYGRNPLSSFPSPVVFRANPWTSDNLITTASLMLVLHKPGNHSWYN